jgi:hypothetical protein
MGIAELSDGNDDQRGLAAALASEMPGAFGTPFLNGCTSSWDVTIGRWVATSDAYGTVLHGKDQAELNEALRAHVLKLADELSAILRAAPGHGYSPPPCDAQGRLSAEESSGGRQDPQRAGCWRACPPPVLDRHDPG